MISVATIISYLTGPVSVVTLRRTAADMHRPLRVRGLPIYLYYQARSGWVDFGRQLRGASWFIVYLPVVALVSWAGSAKFGGHNHLTWGWDLVVVAVVGLVFFLWGVGSGWRTPAVARAHVDQRR